MATLTIRFEQRLGFIERLAIRQADPDCTDCERVEEVSSPHLRHPFQPDGLLLILTIGVDGTVFEVNPFPRHFDFIPIQSASIHKRGDLSVELVGYRERDLVAHNFAVGDRSTFVIAVHLASKRVPALSEPERKILRISVPIYGLAGPDAGNIRGPHCQRSRAHEQEQSSPSHHANQYIGKETGPSSGNC